jgi:hypothetical protein
LVVQKEFYRIRIIMSIIIDSDIRYKS